MTVTEDDFLGGRLRITQPAMGFRAGVDAVLLAAACPATSGARVLELGCGVGTALLCVGTRVPALHLTGVEVQPEYADLARQNAAANGLPATIVTADLAALPADLRQMQFDCVLMNPPYYDRARSTAADDAGRDRALAGARMEDWIATAARRLAPRGQLTLIQRITSLPEVLAATQGKLGSISILPLAARTGRTPELFLMRATKGGRADFRLLAARIMHSGAHHTQGADYTDEIEGVLRRGDALDWR
ncbi:N-6 Adenine-specific DNA methylase [Ketogulonicigenium robustum]|uniref:N-6 Adenine-specific DNA methylase n=1 Tax=Ketogulonicigenium robustum TaxID=92947 RepID=A0A1W6NX57_9RHOB|nr:N-6 Adenine-specific DNA methylase [Ketogulonicigenium robustum]